MDLFGWLIHRALNPGAAHNSLDDLLGAGTTKKLEQEFAGEAKSIAGNLLHANVVAGLTSGLQALVSPKITDAAHAADTIATHLEAAVGTLSSGLASQVKALIQPKIASLGALELSSVPGLVQELSGQIGAFLHL